MDTTQEVYVDRDEMLDAMRLRAHLTAHTQLSDAGREALAMLSHTQQRTDEDMARLVREAAALDDLCDDEQDIVAIYAARVALIDTFRDYTG